MNSAIVRGVVLHLVAAVTVFPTTPIAADDRPPRDKVVGIATMTDGDSIRIRGVPIRLYGIDAPEAGQNCNMRDGSKWPCGAVATNALAHLAEGRALECDRAPDAHDPYGRMIAVCKRDDGMDVNAETVKRGLAWSFRRYSHKYDEVEERAKARGYGIWQASCSPHGITGITHGRTRSAWRQRGSLSRVTLLGRGDASTTRPGHRRGARSTCASRAIVGSRPKPMQSMPGVALHTEWCTITI
jgi:endonuclease YncB( thermonuclease family)